MRLVLLIGGYSESSGVFLSTLYQPYLCLEDLAPCFIVSLFCSLVLHRGFADKAAGMLRCSTVEVIIINCTVQAKKGRNSKGDLK